MTTIDGDSRSATAGGSDILSSIHCGYDQLQPTKSKSDEAQKTKRRVRFPDDEVISDYLEPFRPVPDNCTSEELIAAYLESCFQYKVAPIEFLLEQLKGIDLSICNERYSRLSLKGIRLNRLQVETLEEIFRRVHFRELDFEGTYLDDQSAVAFFDMLLHYETCNELSVTLNLDRMHPSQAWTRCVTFLRRSSELCRFALSHTPLSVSNFLGLSFFGLCLDCLSLRDCSLSGQALFGLVRWLRLLLSSTSLEPPGRDKSNGGVRNHRRQSNGRHARPTRTDVTRLSNKRPSIWELKLDLSFNKLNVTDAETLLMLIRHQILVPRVTHSPHHMPPSGKDTSEEASESPTPPEELLPVGGIGFLIDLDVSNNNLGDDGLRVLCTGLLQCYRNRLRQVHSEQPTVTGQEAVEDVSSISTDDCPSSFTHSSDEVSVCVRGLERLCVANNGLTASGMQIVALLLMQTPQRLVPLVGGLVSLDLSNNPGIRDEGTEILCDGLIRNHSLKELYLRAIRMSFTGIFALSGFLSESKCLRMLDIRSNQLDLAGLMALSKTLALNFTLTGFLSDARSFSASDSSLLATDAELILFLIDEIDTCLRRNRALLEESADPPTVTTTTVSTSPSGKPTDTVNATVDVQSSSTATIGSFSDPHIVNATVDVKSSSIATIGSFSDPRACLSEVILNPAEFQVAHEKSDSSSKMVPSQNVLSNLNNTKTSTFEDTELLAVGSFGTADVPLGSSVHEEDPPAAHFVESVVECAGLCTGSVKDPNQWMVVQKQLDDHPGAPTQTRKSESKIIAVSPQKDGLCRFYGQEINAGPSGLHCVSLQEELPEPHRVENVLAERIANDVIDGSARLPKCVHHTGIFPSIEQQCGDSSTPYAPKSTGINQRSESGTVRSCQGGDDYADGSGGLQKHAKATTQQSTRWDDGDSVEHLSTPQT
ncbi:leucine Rich repeat-containing domain protein [Opisthorchis viverrini]|uniref:Leucine Rich repeat-containing domain protein n=1 Tax=Opisthorchis viverrini TaxID=6198 RepID=A0A1S8WUA0_OPIVI|nr:leucine Rich repeat-containing domain protein [Opisthorchis viverrini]